MSYIAIAFALLATLAATAAQAQQPTDPARLPKLDWYWVGPSKQMPLPPLLAGQEAGQPVHICRASLDQVSGNGPWRLGKLRFEKGCSIVRSGREYVTDKYEALVGRPSALDAVKWLPSSGGQAVPNAFDGAYGGRGIPQFLCRAQTRNGVVPGEIFGKACKVLVDGVEANVESYEVLIAHAP